MPREFMEAEVTVEGVCLTNAQVMAMRVAVSNMLVEVTDAKYADRLGKKLSGNYADRLREVENMLVDGGNKRMDAAELRKRGIK